MMSWGWSRRSAGKGAAASSLLWLCLAGALSTHQALALTPKEDWVAGFERGFQVWVRPQNLSSPDDPAAQVDYWNVAAARTGEFGLEVAVTRPSSQPWHIQLRVGAGLHAMAACVCVCAAPQGNLAPPPPSGGVCWGTSHGAHLSI